MGRVTAILDRYGAEWAVMRGEVCREILRLRDACLERRRGELVALGAVLAEQPDPAVTVPQVAIGPDHPDVAICLDDLARATRWLAAHPAEPTTAPSSRP